MPRARSGERLERSYVWDAVFNSTKDGLFVADKHGNILRINPASERVFGMTAAEVQGMNAAELERLGVFYPSATLQAISRRQPVSLLQRTKRGGYRLVTANPLLDQTGEITYVVGNSRDVSELQALQHDVSTSRTTLGRVTAELGEMSWDRSLTIVAASAEMQEILRLVRQVAAAPTTVLVQGESGVGKEIVARLLHESSPRGERPFIKINCGSIPETLFESELFGYEKGAFTGALTKGKPGKVELADGGTLFLDEIGEMPLAMQVKLLQVTEERSFMRVGGTQPIKVDVRIVTATNRDLAEMVRERRFRADLYYRLNVIPINIPPLRERRSDITPMAIAFLSQICLERGLQRILTPEVLPLLERYDWPGNVRELQNLIERLAVSQSQVEITVDALPLNLRGSPTATVRSSGSDARAAATGVVAPEAVPVPHSIHPAGLVLRDAVDQLERELIIAACERHHDIRSAAVELDIHFSTLSRKITRLFGGLGELRRLIEDQSAETVRSHS